MNEELQKMRGSRGRWLEEQLKGPGQELGRCEQPLWLESRPGRSRGQAGQENRSHKACRREGLWLLFYGVKPKEGWSRGMA